jgi:hypothetical protein
MADTRTMTQGLKERGPYLVWELMTDEEQLQAATALWQGGDRDARTIVEMALAKALKFRPGSLRKLPADKLLARLVRMTPELPETIVFQFLFYFHMAEKRPLMVEFLDAVGLPHDDGVLTLDDDTEPPADDIVDSASRALLEAHPHEAVVYLATLLIADSDLWSGVEPVLNELEEPAKDG